MKVLIYDGECNMCSKFVRLVVKLNRNPKLFITDFNSEWTKQNIRMNQSIDSMVFVSGFNKYIYSDAVINLATELDWKFKPVQVFKLVPKVVRDFAYKKVAENRKKLFKNTQCELPSEKFKKMYLE
jgi:predicted DCC family thiol-disulfide oxidoreductase YuxK